MVTGDTSSARDVERPPSQPREEGYKVSYRGKVCGCVRERIRGMNEKYRKCDGSSHKKYKDMSKGIT